MAKPRGMVTELDFKRSIFRYEVFCGTLDCPRGKVFRQGDVEGWRVGVGVNCFRRGRSKKQEEKLTQKDADTMAQNVQDNCPRCRQAETA